MTSTDDRASVLNTIRLYDTYTRDSVPVLKTMKENDEDENWDNDLQEPSTSLHLLGPKHHVVSRSATNIVEAQLRALQGDSQTRQRTSILHLAAFQLSNEDANDPFWDDDDSMDKANLRSALRTTALSRGRATIMQKDEKSKLQQFREADDETLDGMESVDMVKELKALHLRQILPLPDVR